MTHHDRTWTTQPEAAALVTRTLDEALTRVPEAQALATRLREDIGVRLIDLLDYIWLPSGSDVSEFLATGWEPDAADPGVLRNPTGLFPAVLASGSTTSIGFKVEYVHEFVAAQGLSAPVEGAMHAPFRRVRFAEANGVAFDAIERRGTRGFEPSDPSAATLRAAQLHLQTFRTRRRSFDSIGAGYDATDAIVAAAVADLGQDWACWLWLRAEREYWESRNSAGRLQKARQDVHGIGWANQDHHTYDSSREWFHRCVGVLEALGFECRELFYAGDAAGWGSQILEQPAIGSVIFADIDLAPDELDIDFAHIELEPLPFLRRAGLWCGLHGESMLESGINHLECMYDHTIMSRQLEKQGVRFMQPFSDFPHLYQALTEGEWWPVDPARVDALEAAGYISAEAAEDFRLHGSIGSHLENLERNDGFKGFNQPGIDGVLRVLDPRKNLVGA
ncbi:MAG: hypothetical protein B7C55_13450 [Actinomycetales bacterium mxb001]|nr:MAG: hypothetical protein B7C55_13450 [Actinomycetales bacterium mxb001]